MDNQKENFKNIFPNRCRGFRRGQSLIEILVALGVGTIMLLGAITALAPALKSTTDVTKGQVSAALAKELLDGVRTASEGSWHNIDNLTTGSANKYFLNMSTSTYSYTTGTESVLLDGIATGTIGYWKFDEATGTRIMDQGGFGNSLNVVGAYATSGILGNAIYFNGSSDYATTTNKITGSNPYTISAWVKISAFNDNYRGFVYLGASGADHSAYVGLQSNNTLGGGYYGHNLGTGITPTLGVWYFIAQTYGADGYTRIYVNGSLATSTNAYTPDISAGEVGMARITSDGYYFNGSIDDARIFNRALSASEISAIYKAQNFFRDFYVDDVYRDSSGNIVAYPSGSLDPSSKKVTVEYGWPLIATRTIFMYLSRYQNKNFFQTDWSGGPNANGVISTSTNSFATSSAIDYSTTTGSISILGL